MAVLKRSIDNEATINYIGTLAILCAISCTIIMLRFKAKLNLSGKRKKEIEDNDTSVSINGAYRVNREEFFDYGSLSEVPKKNITPAMVNLPASAQQQLRPTKSTNDLAQAIQKNDAQILRASTPEVILDPRGKVENPIENNKTKKQTEKQERDQKKLEKQQAMLQKRKDKIIANEQAKQEKLRKELEKKEAQKQAKEAKKNKSKNKAPPVPTAVTNQPTTSDQPVAQPRSNNPLAKGVPYSTNTLESSISRSSGPPPYAETQKTEVVKNKQDKTGNTSFGKKVESDDSWDLVSRHREQMKPTSNVGNNRPKQMVLDLQFGNKATTTPSVVHNSGA